jgi:hypothetical protein
MEVHESAGGAAALQAHAPPEPLDPREPSALPVATSAPPDRVGLPEVLTAAGGLLALGATVAVGSGGADIGRVSPSVVLSTIGALVLTAPAVVVGHQYLRVDTPVSAVVDRIAAGLGAGGRLAWGIVPVALFFAATAPGSWRLVLAALCGGVVAVLLGRAAVGLDRLAPGRATWRLAVVAWVAVTLAIGLRLVATLIGG